jgi:hypothetical protein
MYVVGRLLSGCCSSPRRSRYSAAFNDSLTVIALWFARVVATNSPEDFHLQVDCHAGHTTTNKSPRSSQAPDVASSFSCSRLHLFGRRHSAGHAFYRDRDSMRHPARPDNSAHNGTERAEGHRINDDLKIRSLACLTAVTGICLVCCYRVPGNRPDRESRKGSHCGMSMARRLCLLCQVEGQAIAQWHTCRNNNGLYLKAEAHRRSEAPHGIGGTQG